MRPTPDYSAWYDYTDSVYEPSEDSFVFLDGIEKELEDKCLGKEFRYTSCFVALVDNFPKKSQV